MGEGIEQSIIQLFPKLASDKDFKLTSPYNPKYNCIAWAYNIENRWMWPNDGIHFLDGVHYWPDERVMDDNVENFIDAFRLKGYEVCDNASFEIEYKKIALYIRPGTKKCLHASRQLRSGFWTSKLGPCWDIQHGTPYSIEGNEYGEVYCIMSMKFF